MSIRSVNIRATEGRAERVAERGRLFGTGNPNYLVVDGIEERALTLDAFSHLVT